ncbi:MAG: lytic transglycosylase domain-containing protein, partial [Hyphomonadaceae bacterium]
WPSHDRLSGSAAHYWAARARLAAGDARGVIAHLESAAQFPMTFYGQLAEAQLGRQTALRLASEELDADTLRAFLERRPAARRAAAYAQLGRLSDVEAELRRLHGQITPQDDVTYLALAEALAAPSAQLRAADYGGPEVSAGLCPTTTFTPENGFTLDRALLYAIVRQESAFNPVAVSSSNARGLMQLLPSTANDMDRERGYRRNPSLLFEPGENMRLGQQYVLWLMDQFHRDGDLARVFAAYNGGPGWLQRWLQATGETNDPLLLLETLPRQESRDYAERVLSHMAICRRKFGQPIPELESLAAGRPAFYQALDDRGATRVAAQ